MISKIREFKSKLTNMLPMDKCGHAVYGTATYAVLAPFGELFALFCVVLIALLTEVFDYMGSGNAEFNDFVATITIPLVLYIGTFIEFDLVEYLLLLIKS